LPNTERLDQGQVGRVLQVSAAFHRISEQLRVDAERLLSELASGLREAKVQVGRRSPLWNRQRPSGGWRLGVADAPANDGYSSGSGPRLNR
jgi:hypothetical protein